jgi:HAD superfamily hydrolase (TIGR01509 family)
MAKSRTVRGVLFDVDGTLIDSGYLHAVAWWQALRKKSLDVPMATIHRAIGMGADRLLPHVLGEEPDEDLQSELAAAHDALFSVHWPALRRLPGAQELVRLSHTHGLTTVLASSAGADEVEVLRRVLDADDALDHVTSSADGENSKPEPDLVLVALDKAGLDPSEAIFIGDAVWDVHASAEAGVRCLGVECGGTSAAELREAGAQQTFKDPADLLAHWSETPLASS